MLSLAKSSEHRFKYYTEDYGNIGRKEVGTVEVQTILAICAGLQLLGHISSGQCLGELRVRIQKPTNSQSLGLFLATFPHNAPHSLSAP